MTDQIIYAELPGCEHADHLTSEVFCKLRNEFCKLIKVCPLGYIKESK